MRNTALLLSLLLCTLFAQSQELNWEHKEVYVLDKVTLEPIEGVLGIVANRDVGESDSNGRLVFLRHVRNLSPTLIFFKDGYALDSVTLPYVPDTVYLKRLTDVLEEAIVTDKKVELLLRSGTENVVDFGFVDDYILVASHSGYDGKGAKLFVLDDYGDTISMQRINVPPKSLYKSCVGQYYLVSYNAIYPIDIDLKKKKIALGKWKPIATLDALKRCVLYADSTYYYKFVNRRRFNVTFALAKEGDTAIRSFKELDQPDVLIASVEDQMRVIKLLEEGKDKEAAHIQRLATMWDNSSFKRIDNSLFKKGDSLMIFDFDEHQIHYYSLGGYKYASIAANLTQGDLFRTILIQDETTKAFYVLNERQSAQNIRSVSLKDAALGGSIIRLEKPFANNVKIRDRKIYYLWHNGKGSTKQLYIQRNSIK